MNCKKPKILLIVDRPNWAYHHLANYIIEELGDKYEFYLDFIVYNKKTSIRNPLKKIKYFIKTGYPAIKHRRVLSPKNEYDIVFYFGWYMDFACNFNLNAKAIIKGIYTTGFPPRGFPVFKKISIEAFINKYLANAHSVVCGSEQIYNFYRKYIGNIYYANGTLFPQPLKPKDKRKNNNGLIIGWTGNPNRDFKGFYDYVKPAIEKASNLRKGIKLLTRFSGSLKTLPKFYQKVDVVLVASICDAGPSMFMQAGLCGVPAIATRSGMPLEIINHMQNGIFIKRDIDEMVSAIVYLYDHRDLLKNMSIQIHKDILGYYDKVNMPKRWEKIFSETLERINISNI
jgi:hypothetical protein